MIRFAPRFRLLEYQAGTVDRLATSDMSADSFFAVAESPKARARRRHDKRAVWMLLAWGVFAMPAPAREVDCRACNYCADKGDLASALTARIQQHIADGKSARQIAEWEGGGSFIRPRIEQWADRRPEAVRADRRLLKYRGSGLPDGLVLSAYAPCVKVNGICLGTEKLAHLFQHGWEYYRIAVLDGHGDARAIRYGEWQEGLAAREQYAADEPYFLRQPMGWPGYGGYGRRISGVISHADLAANQAGLQFYKDIAAGRFKTIADYVTKDFCEETNPNEYTPAMRRWVETNSATNKPPSPATSHHRKKLP